MLLSYFVIFLHGFFLFCKFACFFVLCLFVEFVYSGLVRYMLSIYFPLSYALCIHYLCGVIYQGGVFTFGDFSEGWGWVV